MEKTKIVVDTNIFVSAFLGSKNAKFILREIINDEYELVMCQKQLKELETVLKRPKFQKYISVCIKSNVRNLGGLTVASIGECMYQPKKKSM